MSAQDTPSYLSPGCGVAGQELSFPFWGDTPAKVGSHPEATWGCDLGSFPAGPRVSSSLPGDAFQPLLEKKHVGPVTVCWPRPRVGCGGRAGVGMRRVWDLGQGRSRWSTDRQGIRTFWDLPLPRVTPPQKCPARGEKGLESTSQVSWQSAHQQGRLLLLVQRHCGPAVGLVLTQHHWLGMRRGR